MGEIVKNSFALITGASAGIGKQFAIECAKRSLNLFLISLPDTGLESLEIDLKGEYQIEIHTLCIDLTSKNAPMKVHHYAMQNNIVVSILVNNAGVGFDGKLENLSVDLIDEMILMKKLRKAYILNISSFSALTPLPNKCVYAATKSYLLYLTNAINYELKGTSVHALSVHPSGVSSERNLESIQRSSFIARISTLKPEEVAQLSIKNLLAGKKFIVPGTVTKIYYYLGLLLPTFIVLPIVSKVFRKTN